MELLHIIFLDHDIQIIRSIPLAYTSLHDYWMRCDHIMAFIVLKVAMRR